MFLVVKQGLPLLVLLKFFVWLLARSLPVRIVSLLQKRKHNLELTLREKAAFNPEEETKIQSTQTSDNDTIHFEIHLENVKR